MADFNIKSKRDDEIEKLAATLRKNKLASSDYEARRMATDMLETGKKVSDDFSQKERQMLGDRKKDAEVELAHKQVEQLTANIARGRGDVRINLEGIDLNKPLKELVAEEEEVREEPDEDDGVELKGDADGFAAESSEKAADEIVEEQEPVEVPIPEQLEAEPIERLDEDVQGEEAQDADVPADEPVADEVEDVPADEPVEAPFDEVPADEITDEPQQQAGEEPAGDEDVVEPVADEVEDAPADEPSEDVVEPVKQYAPDEAPDDECAEGEGDPDFSVKELETKEQLQKSEDERKKEREKMPESNIDLSNVFNVNK